MSVFSKINVRRPGRSVFNLSYDKKFTCDMGQLIPIMCEEMVPGDKFNIGNEMVIRFQPLVAPILHEINAFVHYFFVPYRLLWDEWETFITGGVSGDETAVLPRWEPTGTDNVAGKLWDFLGFPLNVDPDGAYPLNFPKDAYYTIFREYYRDPNLSPESYTLPGGPTYVAGDIVRRAWQKDYFTSALPWQQRGTAPALPISGTSMAVFKLPLTSYGGTTQGMSFASDVGTVDRPIVPGSNANLNATNWLNGNTVDLSTASTFDIADLRLAFQIQRWMEANARGGPRYTEFLNSHFAVSPRDETLQRPVYIGGTKTPVVISEVLQTSATETGKPQGNMAGHGLSASQSYAGSYFAKEFGLVMGILSVMPRPSYNSQGINRQWLRRTKYDFYFPEFANLSEQAVERAEIYASNVEAENKTIFGYQGRYNEMRYKPSMTCSGMRSTYSYWHLSRNFSTAPLLNSSFIRCEPRKDIFAVTTEPGLIVHFGNLIKAVRPLPVYPEPGRIDH